MAEENLACDRYENLAPSLFNFIDHFLQVFRVNSSDETRKSTDVCLIKNIDMMHLR